MSAGGGGEAGGPAGAPVGASEALSLICSLRPSGRIAVRAGASGADAAGASAPLPGRAARRVLEAFDKGRGAGVLHLGAAEPGTILSPALAFWRDLGKAFLAEVCRASDPSDPKALRLPDPPAETLEGITASAPPMQGAERITPALLAEVWADAGAALVAEVARRKKGLQGFLQAQGGAWNVVGRVCLHLAETKRNPSFPFAFMATYVTEVSRTGSAQHLPLGRALSEYAGARNRRQLVALLAPLSRAAEESDFLRALVDSGDVYHPLSWSAAEAYQFLRDVPAYEKAGLVVRLPDWWRARRRPRARVTATVGGNAPATLGLDALLDFHVGVTLDGVALTREEMRQILAGSEGLVLLRGQWVEVAPDRLQGVLSEWDRIRAQAGEEGVSFGQAMRMLSGAWIQDDADEDVQQARPAWSEVVAGEWLSERLAALRSPEWAAEIDAGAGLDATLRPYQKGGVQWLQTLRSLGLGGVLADDMGLGKTIQVLAVLNLARRRREKGTDLLVVPASLVENWRQEAARFAPKLKLLVAHPSRIPSAELKRLGKRRVSAHHAVITTYATLARTAWMRTYPWRAVILDEAQAIKNPGAKQTRAVKALSARWRVALTGTPVENRLGDLWSIFDFLNPNLLGTRTAFGQFCKRLSASPAGYAPLRRLVQPYILRRLKTDRAVISDLPDKVEVNAYCGLSRRQAALYQQSVDEMARALETLDGMERRGVVLSYLMRFKQICNHPSQWLGDGAWDPRDSGKLARLRELCEPVAARQEKMLVFTQFRQMTGPLALFLADVFGGAGLVLHGGVPVRKRAGLVARFQEQDEVPFLVLSLKVGGTGLNLTAASHVIHFDRWWNPAVENQATDRAFRIGQRRNVMVHKFVCRGTVEERIDEMLQQKQALADEILSGGGEPALTELSNEELVSLVSLDLSRATDR